MEGLNGVQSLNLQNGLFAAEAFSLFYTYVAYACVDSIAAEYNQVAWHILPGGGIEHRCFIGTEENGEVPVLVYPNPARDYLNVASGFKKDLLYDVHGRLLRSWDNPPGNKVQNIEKGM